MKSDILETMLNLLHSGNHVQLAYGRNHVTFAILETIWYLLYWKPWEIHCLLETIWNLLFTGNLMRNPLFTWNHEKSAVYWKPCEIYCILETMGNFCILLEAMWNLSQKLSAQTIIMSLQEQSVSPSSAKYMCHSHACVCLSQVVLVMTLHVRWYC